MKEQIITIKLPSRNEASVFSNMRGAHVALRAADYADIVKLSCGNLIELAEIF